MSPDLILLHAPSVYDFREKAILYGPVSDQIPSSPVFEMYPIGFASLAEYLERAGYRVRIVNLAVRMLNSQTFNAEKMIQRLEAPLFGIDLHWMVHCHGSIEVARLVKKHHPESKVVFGGLSASYYYRELMEYPEIDYVLRGDSTEEPLRQLVASVREGKPPETVPNLVWRDRQGVVRNNPFSYVPNDLGNVMLDHYGNVVRSVFRYRDFSSHLPFKGWAEYPITAVMTCRGCTHNCVICGASASAFRHSYYREKPAFRPPEAVARDIKQVARFTSGPAFIIGDPRQAGEDYARELFRHLQANPVKNQLIFELFYPAPKELLHEMKMASPHFCLEISPESHDLDVMRAGGRLYTSAGLEQTIGDALDIGCGRLDIFFMIGLPQQTARSVMETVEFCGHLWEKFRGDKRLFLFIAPLSPFLDPGSLAFEQPERYGYRVLYHGLEEHRKALLNPSWKYALNYETTWLTREQIVETAYLAMMRLNSLKGKYGVITPSLADAENERLKAGLEMVHRLDDLIARGDSGEELARLKPQMDRINMSRMTHWAELRLPLGLVKLKPWRALWAWATGRL